MAIYAVHCPAGEADAAVAFERARVVRLGFSWGAFLLGPVWLLARRVWRPLAFFILAAALVGFLTAEGVIGTGAAVSLYGVYALYLGFEGRAFFEAALDRRGSPLARIVCAADLSTAELGFLDREHTPVRAAAPQTRPPHSPPPPQVLGLFPEAHR